MTKRQSEKIYKRKWQRMFAGYMSQLMHVNVKQSRVKLRVSMGPHAMIIKGMSRGYELNLEFTDKPQHEDKKITIKEEAEDGVDANE